jgi:hypothetical protein
MALSGRSRRPNRKQIMTRKKRRQDKRKEKDM